MTSLSTLARRALRFASTLALVPAVLAAQGTTGTLTGRVLAGGAPVVGATVLAGGRGAPTRADGSYRLTLPPGRYQVRVRAIGFNTASDSVTITPGGTATANISLSRAIATLETVSTLGTRGEARTVIDAPVPIDVLSAAEIKATGRTETAQMIQAVAPSFNFPRTSIGDGTDHVRPATLRGLAPDQTLVLVNGKRRHNSALVNVNGFVGRGSAPVDLNAIPSSMIDHIEILRDGAAAQYGSDAIAGVVNIVLKSGVSGELRTTLGQAYSTYNRSDDVNVTPYTAQVGDVSARDGKVFQTALDKGFTFSQNGFLHLAAELRDRGQTNRSLEDPRVQYGVGDPRETNAALPSPDGRVNHRQGDGSTHDVQGWWNGGATLGSGINLYSFGGISTRKGEATGFWRRPNDDRTLRNIYPNGFLPIIHSDIYDASGAVGVKGIASGWNWDLGTGYGQNQFGFVIKNTANVSLGPTSPTQFDAGKLRFGQSTTTLDLNRDFKDMLPFPVNVAAGAEFRADKYTIVAGEPDSWRNGGATVIDVNGVTTTRPGAPGAQVFPGFKADSGTKKGDAGTHSRNNTALYADVSSDLTSRLLVDLAGRYENYSDFGSTTTGKISSRLQVAKGVALRGSASTGFRAPSLMQEWFSSTATNFVGGVPFDIKTFTASSPEALALGSSPLKAEKSRNYGIGLALEPVPSFSLTTDYYVVGIDDRIVLSNNFTGAAATAALNAVGVFGIQGGRFFTNAIDTKTHGYDIIANYGVTLANSGVVRLSAAYNHNRTRVTRVDTLPTPLALLKTSLFDRVEQARIEDGNPESNLILSGNFDYHRLGLVLRSQRFGQVTSFGAAPTNAFGPLDQTFSPKWITDASVSYGFRELTLSVGADNIFDVYPDRNNNNGSIVPTGENGGTSNFGIFPYAGISPFGFNGRFIYTRVAVAF